MRIESINTTHNSLKVQWNNGTTSDYLWHWLRDHSESPDDLHPNSLQRQVDTLSSSFNNTVDNVYLDDTGEQIHIKWNDQGQSNLSSALLESMALPTRPQPQPLEPVEIWHRPEDIKHVPKMTYDSLMDDDEGVKKWLNHIQRVGFVLVCGSPASAQATQEMMEKISYIRNSVFGEFSVWDNKTSNPVDTAYTSLEIEPHTDGTYTHDAPGLQTLHCLQREAIGGDNQFIDGLAIAQEMQQEHPQSFKTLCSVQIPGRYIGANTHLQTHRPVFRTNDSGQVLQVSFNNHDRAPFRLADDEMERFYEAYGIFYRLAHQQQRQFQYCLNPGTILTFDNWRLLHGRAALTGYRQLCGGYHNREDFESLLRAKDM
ncbi:MAG: TauD/TfdA family dioxygenase [Gammaproteobacteria bacterium]|nr:TauD/TfdA family dioxygenase [Gammaproteobacteria bacterium]